MNVPFTPHGYHNRDSYGAIIPGMILLGMLMIVIGVYYLNIVLNFTVLNTDTYNLTKAIMMSFVLVMGMYTLNKKSILEGLSMILIGTSTAVFSVTALITGNNGLIIMDVLIGITLLFISFVFMCRKDYVLFCGTFIGGVGFTIHSLFSGDANSIVMGITCALTGVFFLIHGVSVWYALCTDKERYSWQNDTRAKNAAKSVSSAGFVIMSLLSIMVGLYYLNNTLHFMTIDYIPYNVAKIIMSAIIIYYAVLAFWGGNITSGMMSLMFGSSTFTFSASALAQGLGGVEILDIMFGIGMLFACIIAYKEEYWSMCAVGGLMFFALSMYPFLSGDIIYYTVGVPIIIVGLILGYGAIKNIYDTEVLTYKGFL